MDCEVVYEGCVELLVPDDVGDVRHCGGFPSSRTERDNRRQRRSVQKDRLPNTAIRYPAMYHRRNLLLTRTTINELMRVIKGAVLLDDGRGLTQGWRQIFSLVLPSPVEIPVTVAANLHSPTRLVEMNLLVSCPRDSMSS